MPADVPNNAIELRVDRLAQLFHSLDPYPFRERDLDKEAEDYIVSWARELEADQPLKIVVHVPSNEAQSKAAQELHEAFARYFAYRAEIVQRELNELFRPTPARHWLRLLAGALLLAAAATWAVWGGG